VSVVVENHNPRDPPRQRSDNLAQALFIHQAGGALHNCVKAIFLEKECNIGADLVWSVAISKIADQPSAFKVTAGRGETLLMMDTAAACGAMREMATAHHGGLRQLVDSSRCAAISAIPAMPGLWSSYGDAIGSLANLYLIEVVARKLLA
jgi:hypothetical protein